MYICTLLPTLLSIATAVQDQIVIPNDVTTADTIHDKLTTSSIIPEVLDDFDPLIHLDVLYPNYETVFLGNEIPTRHVSHRPIFTLSRLRPDKPKRGRKYTMILTDPDATSRENPKWSEMCHWILTGIPAPYSVGADTIAVESSAELIEYLAPAPPKSTGLHRYVFVLLEGNSTDIVAPKERKHWGYGKVRHGVRDWAAENDLKVVGANFFYAQHKKQ